MVFQHHFYTILCAWVTLTFLVQANPFSEQSPEAISQPLGAAEPVGPESLLDKLERVMGKEHRAKIQERVVRISLALRPTFTALPRTVEDRVQPAAVSFLLHRYFVDRHGWYVRGFDPAGGAWNSTSPASVFEDQTREIFEEPLSSSGLSLEESAVLAATLEELVHSETVERLHAAYRVTLRLKTERSAKEFDIIHIIDNYMMMYVLGRDHKKATRKSVLELKRIINKVYPNWGVTQKWIRQVRSEVMGADPTGQVSFSSSAVVLDEIANRYGRWQDKECQDLKKSLVVLEQSGTGRVPLTRFYGAALKGDWQFSESEAYLRQLGALDESDPKQPSVVIPNYINAASNCVASSKFYSVCCINECDALLGHVESEIASPEARPERIIEVVEALPSASVQAPRRLPPLLVQRLHDIAVQNNGKVPLHARLFLQWLHHAYPRECPVPHLSGTSKQMTLQSMSKTKMSPIADEKTMQHFVKTAPVEPAEKVEMEELPWYSEEELLLQPPRGVGIRLQLMVIGQGLFLVIAVVACSMTVSSVRSAKKAKAVVSVEQHAKLSV